MAEKTIPFSREMMLASKAIDEAVCEGEPVQEVKWLKREDMLELSPGVYLDKHSLLDEFKKKLESDPDRYRQYILGSWDLGDGEKSEGE